MARVVVASSQSAMGEGLYLCPADGEQLPGMRPESALAAGRWDIPCPVCGGPLELQVTPERVSNPQNAYGMSKLGEEMVAVNLGRRYGIPTVALRYSIVQGPRQSVYNAYSGACRIFCLSYLQGDGADPVRGRRGHPRLRQHRRRGRRQRARARRRARRRAGLQRRWRQAVTTREFADIVHAAVRLRRARERLLASTASATPATSSPTSALSGSSGWAPRRCRPTRSRRTRTGSRAWTGLTGCWPRRTPGCAPSGWSGRPTGEGFPPRRRRRQSAEADHRHHPEVHGGRQRPPLLDIWLDALRPGRRRRGAGQPAPPAGRGRATSRRADRRRPPWHGLRAGTARQRRHARRQPRLGRRGGLRSWPATPTTSPTSTCGRWSRPTGSTARSPRLTVFHSDGPSAGGVVEIDDAGRVTGFAEKPASTRSPTWPTRASTPSTRACWTRSTARRRGTSATDLLPRLVGRAQAVLVDGYFRDIGTADAYRRAREEWPVRALR